MERRDWSLKALEELIYIDSLPEAELRATKLQKWTKSYLQDNSIEDFDLPLAKLELLSELFYKNIHFLRNQREALKEELQDNSQIKKFFSHQI